MNIIFLVTTITMENSDNDEDFKSSTVSVSIENESDYLLCVPQKLNDFRYSYIAGNIMYTNENLDRTDAEININESDFSIKTFRRRNMFVKE